MTITMLPPADSFDDFEFAAMVADFDLPEDSAEEPARTFRPTKAAERQAARNEIARQLGIRRHRSNEREA